MRNAKSPHASFLHKDSQTALGRHKFVFSFACAYRCLPVRTRGGCNRKCNRDSSQPEQRPNGASEAEAKSGENRTWLLQGQPVPQTIPHHLSREQTLSWFWSADLEHLRGILLVLALVSILTFYSIMQACCAKPSWIPSQNRNSGMKKKPTSILSKGDRA